MKKKTKMKQALVFDVWVLVFEEMLKTAKASNDHTFVYPETYVNTTTRKFFRDARTVCHDFNTILTPLAYGLVDLYNRDVVLPGSGQREESRLRFLKNLLQYTRVLRINRLGQADPICLSAVADVVQMCDRLYHIDIDPKNRSRDMIAEVISRLANSFLQKGQHHIIEWWGEQLTIWAMEPPLRHRPSEPGWPLRPYRPMEQVEGQSTLIRKSNGPARLTVSSVMLGAHHDFYNSPFFHYRFPPATKITLDYIDWRFTKTSYRRTWDFSNIRNLKLKFVDYQKFLTTVDLGDLADLHTFGIAGQVQEEEGDAERPFFDIDGARGSFQALLEGFKGLTKLSIHQSRWQEFISPSLIWNLGASLKTLKLRDHNYTDVWSIDALSVGDLRSINYGCPNIVTLGVDFPIDEDEQLDFLEVVCSFVKLQHLTFYIAKGTFQISGIVEDGEVEDGEVDGSIIEDARELMRIVKDEKRGCELKSINCYDKSRGWNVEGCMIVSDGAPLEVWRDPGRYIVNVR